MLSKLDQINPFDPDGNEELEALLSALARKGRRVDVRAQTGKFARIIISGTIRKVPPADSGVKKP